MYGEADDGLSSWPHGPVRWFHWAPHRHPAVHVTRPAVHPSLGTSDLRMIHERKRRDLEHRGQSRRYGRGGDGMTEGYRPLRLPVWPPVLVHGLRVAGNTICGQQFRGRTVLVDHPALQVPPRASVECWPRTRRNTEWPMRIRSHTRIGHEAGFSFAEGGEVDRALRPEPPPPPKKKGSIDRTPKIPSSLNSPQHPSTLLVLRGVEGAVPALCKKSAVFQPWSPRVPGP